MRILITDDDHICTMLLATILKPFGECVIAKDGETAIRLFTEGLAQQRPFGLVCLDIQMPVLDGHAVLRSLRAIEAGFGRGGLDGSTVLMTTTRDDNKAIAEAFRGQCEGYVIKPIDRETLLTLLVKLGIRPAANPGRDDASP